MICSGKDNIERVQQVLNVTICNALIYTLSLLPSQEQALPFNVLYTTYDIALIDQDFLSQIPWHYAFIDEDQWLKSPSSVGLQRDMRRYEYLIISALLTILLYQRCLSTFKVKSGCFELTLLQIWDTAGQERFKSLGVVFYRDADSKNVKALYQRAQAYIQLVDLDLAEMDIKKALEIYPDNMLSNLGLFGMSLFKRDVKLEYKLLKEKVKESNKKDAQFYGNIFAKMNKREHLSSAISWKNAQKSEESSFSELEEKSHAKEPEKTKLKKKVTGQTLSKVGLFLQRRFSFMDNYMSLSQASRAQGFEDSML
ncbi:FKBP-type peptidyl-prolyl cis-trans isomerase domain-containing protein [Tanacetum coccineum]